MIKLRPRLKVITEMLPKCNLVCDIGADHAYLPIYLLKNSICKRAIVTEISQGPLNTAICNIKKRHLENDIEVILGDGLKALTDSKFLHDNRDEDYVVIIAGMGGKLIERILMDGIHQAKKANALILQPMSGIEIISEWLIKEGFEIYDGRLVKDDNRIYNVLAVKWTSVQKSYKPIDLYISKKLVEKKDPLLEQYINWKISILNKVILNLKNSKDDKDNRKDNKGNLFKLEAFRNEMINILELLQR